MKKLVHFIRHGQSEQNLGDVFQGAESPLTELGRQQAQFVADRARSLDAEVVLTSPMPRALETARAIARATGLPLEEHDILREYQPPHVLVGRSHTSPEGVAYIAARQAHVEEPDWHFEDEDNYFDLHERARTVLDFLIARPEERIIAVSHAGFMRVILTAMLSEGAADVQLMRRLMRFLRPENTGITVCRYDSETVQRNKWRLLVWNDHAHLGETRRKEPTGGDE